MLPLLAPPKELGRIQGKGKQCSIDGAILSIDEVEVFTRFMQLG
jgi:hypothetical protein